MKPKEKAKGLLDKYFPYVEAFSETQQWDNAKQCALIAVDDILNNIDFTSMLNGTNDYNYWLEVKQEIEKL